VKQFELRIAKRPGLASEIASALWQKGVHIQVFSAQLQEGQEIFHLAVDKAAVAKQTFIENGWKATEESTPWLRPKRCPLDPRKWIVTGVGVRGGTILVGPVRPPLQLPCLQCLRSPNQMPRPDPFGLPITQLQQLEISRIAEIQRATSVVVAHEGGFVQLVSGGGWYLAAFAFAKLPLQQIQIIPSFAQSHQS
jgi:hypothetical protein